MREKQQNRKGLTMRSKLFVGILGVIACQAVLFVSLLAGQGILQRLDNSALDTFGERVDGVQNDLEGEMLQRWSNIDTQAEIIAQALEDYMHGHDMTYAEVQAQPEATTDFLKSVTEEIIFTMRKSSVSGGFLILACDDSEANTFCGLHLSDSDPNYYPSDDSDLLLDVGPASIAKEDGIPLNTNWINRYYLEPAEAENSFFYKPYLAAQNRPHTSGRRQGYWSQAHRVTPTSPEVISYSVPVVLSDQTVAGVLGIDLQVDYLKEFMPYQLLQADRKGIYILGVTAKMDDGTLAFKPMAYSGPLYKRLFGENRQPVVFESRPFYGDTYRLQGSDRLEDAVYGAISYLDLYDNNAPFANERWAVIGIAQEKHLLALSRMVVRTIGFAFAVTLVLAAVIAGIYAGRMTRPIDRMVEELRKSDPTREVVLSATHIQEVDELARAVETLSRNVADSASKLAQIIELLNMPIGAFEYDKRDSVVYATAVMLGFLGIEAQESGYLDKDDFDQRLEALMRLPEKDSEDVYYRPEVPTPGWLKISQLENETAIWGVAMDVTEEILEKQRIQYERDYDLLTHLLNRRAFVNQVTRLFNAGEVGTAAFIMWDLDGLKYINDTYGHDYGDEYIQKAAVVLQGCARFGGLVARMSGDEFYVFIDQISDREQLLRQIQELHRQLLNKEMQMSNGNIIRLSASAGIAWCPSDTDNYETLVRYADFAMYQAKKAQKGTIRQFERESYEKDAFLLSSKEDMDRLINDELLHYVYQPIVSAATGEVLGYEALMRSDLEAIKSPQDILRLATYLAKLHEIEWLSVRGALAGYAAQAAAFGSAKLFINSIPNVCLTDDRIAQLERDYAPYLSQVVLELIESERNDEASIHKKQETIGRWQGDIALDDFGAGYNNDLVLLTLMPVYVKIDMALVAGISHDGIRQNIVRNLLGYFAGTDIKTIAEGVETAEDMAALIGMGVDYLQGYYIGRPERTPQTIAPEVTAQIRRAASTEE